MVCTTHTGPAWPHGWRGSCMCMHLHVRVHVYTYAWLAGVLWAGEHTSCGTRTHASHEAWSMVHSELRLLAACRWEVMTSRGARDTDGPHPHPGTIARDHCQGRAHWEGTPPFEAPKAKRPAVFAVFHVVVPQLPLRGTLFLLPRERHLRTPTCARRWGGGTVSSVSHSAVSQGDTSQTQCSVHSVLTRSPLSPVSVAQRGVGNPHPPALKTPQQSSLRE